MGRDQDGDGFIGIDESTGTYYINVESFPNLGTAEVTVNGDTYAMSYTDWGANAHWYYAMSSPSGTVDWSVTVSNGCAQSQTVTGSFDAPVSGCTDASACNYNADATTDDGSCSFADPGLDCAGNCLADADGDGVCDDDEVVGCQDASACNYNASATDAGDCTFADAGLDCDGNCLSGTAVTFNLADSYGDGWDYSW